MSKALLGHAILYASALAASACAHGGQHVESTSAAAGQAAQQYSWIGEPTREPMTPSGLAQDGPAYLGGRAAQPQSWVSSEPVRTSSSLATASSGSQHQ